MAHIKAYPDDVMSIKFVKSLWWEATHYTPLPDDYKEEKVAWNDDFISLEDVKRIAASWTEIANIMERHKKSRLVDDRRYEKADDTKRR